MPGRSVFFLLKMGITALVIVGAAEIAKRSSWLGGLLVALPLVSILSMTWLYVETRDSARVAGFARDILVMVPPSLLFFLPFLLEPKTHWSFWLNCGLGCAITALGMGGGDPVASRVSIRTPARRVEKPAGWRFFGVARSKIRLFVDSPDSMTQSRFSFFLRIAFLIAVLLGLWTLREDFQHLFERDWIDAHVRGQGLPGYGIFVAAGALVTAFGLSRQAVAFLGGYAFGAGFGLVLSTLATLAGCVLAFFFARFFGRSLVNRRLSGKMQRFDDFVRRDPFSMTLIIRLLPVGSNLATNLLAGVSRIPKGAFFAGSLVGYLPQLLIFSLAGSGITIGSRWQIAISVLLLVISGWLGARLYRRMRRQPDFAGGFDFSSGPRA